jgi:DNA-binding NarL/FixJ family response regulator
MAVEPGSPTLDGVAAIAALEAAGCQSNVVVLTTFSDRERILGALDAGALGYLLKDAEPDEIIRGVAVRGTGRLADRPAGSARGPQPAPPRARTGAGATQRARVRGAHAGRQGSRNKLIARRLEITRRPSRRT